MPSRNLLLLPHYPKNRPEAAPRVSNGSAWRLAAGSGDYCGAESPSLGFVGLGSARGGIGSGARATGMPFRLVVRGMFPETSSRTAGPVVMSMIGMLCTRLKRFPYGTTKEAINAMQQPQVIVCDRNRKTETAPPGGVRRDCG